MTISSRTPEGTPNRCPVCGQAVRVEPSRPFDDAPCPACGTLLWFVSVGTEPRVIDPQASGLIEIVAERLGVTPEEVRAGRLGELGLDSLDVVELIMELEEGTDIGPGPTA
jgi:acyl carrier protein